MLNDKKVPAILPLFYNNTFISNFNELFNEHFSGQCSLIQNKSTIPSVFTPHDIKIIINKLDPNKAHGHDMISIRMIKLYGDSISKPLEMIFKSCLNQGIFPSERKKANVVPVLKITSVWKVTHWFLFFQCLAKYLKDWFITLCLNIF